MYITCKCLNVSVKTRGDELKEFDRDTINDLLTNTESYCDFFQQPLATVNELEGINKVQCGLVVNKYIGLWCIHRCINCSMYTHAVHRNHGASLVLINKNMIASTDEIEKLTLDPKYSEIFKIIIDYNHLNNENNDDDDDDDNDVDGKQSSLPLTKYSISQLSNSIQLTLTTLQQQLEQAIQKQAGIIDDKIRAFTTEQYQLLEQYRERAHIEYNSLSRIICDNNCSNSYHNQESLKTMMINNNVKDNNTVDVRLRIRKLAHDSTVDAMNSNRSNAANDYYDDGSNGENNDDADKNKTINDSTSKNNENFVVDVKKNIGNKLNRKKERYFGRKNDRYDCGETMFALEGMDDTVESEDQEVTSEIEGSDAEDSGQDEGIHIPRGQRGGHPTLAKSLPVSVPNFSTFQRRAMQESEDDQLSMDPLDPHNIRASIKALAKSVHGDAVFGDLPRPRFSTQI